MTISVQLIGQKREQGFIECLRMFALLAGLWKFDLTVKAYDPTLDSCQKVQSATDSGRRLTQTVISYCGPDEGFERYCGDLLSVNTARHMLPEQKVLLFDSDAKMYGGLFRELFGVEAIVLKATDAPLTVVKEGEDPLTYGLAKKLPMYWKGEEGRRMITPNSSGGALLATSQGGCCLSRRGTWYCCTLPVWQLGTPSFPPLYQILRNFIFFSEGKGHFSPYPYVALRIDDYPLASEQYLRSGGVLDGARAEETAELCEWSREYEARLEFMVNSHVVDSAIQLRPLDAKVPKTCATLKSYWQQGIININAHGRTHLDEALYQETGEISPLEFSRLSLQETDARLKQCVGFINNYFGKKAAGFVPPSWSYREGVTKKSCQKWFSFVIDSSKNYRFGSDCQPMGKLDESGLLHLLETWHLGSQELDYREPLLWRSFLECGIPVHMMAHGPYLTDPLPKSKAPRALALGLLLLMLPGATLSSPRQAWRCLKGVCSPVKWNRLAPAKRALFRLPYFRRGSLRDLLATGQRHAVAWLFTESLADHLRDFSGLELESYERGESEHRVRFRVPKQCRGPFLFHAPFTVAAAEVDGRCVSLSDELLSVHSYFALELKDLSAGSHELLLKVA